MAMADDGRDGDCDMGEAYGAQAEEGGDEREYEFQRRTKQILNKRDKRAQKAGKCPGGPAQTTVVLGATPWRDTRPERPGAAGWECRDFQGCGAVNPWGNPHCGSCGKTWKGHDLVYKQRYKVDPPVLINPPWAPTRAQTPPPIPEGYKAPTTWGPYGGSGKGGPNSQGPGKEKGKGKGEKGGGKPAWPGNPNHDPKGQGKGAREGK